MQQLLFSHQFLDLCNGLARIEVLRNSKYTRWTYFIARQWWSCVVFLYTDMFFTLGHVLVQFMMVWHLYTENGSLNLSSLSFWNSSYQNRQALIIKKPWYNLKDICDIQIVAEEAGDCSIRILFFKLGVMISTFSCLTFRGTNLFHATIHKHTQCLSVLYMGQIKYSETC